MLDYLGTGFSVIELGNSIFKGMVPVNLANHFSTVTILALEIPEPNLKVVIDYLTCFPYLEKLHVKMPLANPFAYCSLLSDSVIHRRSNILLLFLVLCEHMDQFDTSMQCDPFAPIECLNRSLKTIVLQAYSGLKPHVEFAKFFIERARVLEIMKFCSVSGCEPKWLRSQRKKLNIDNRLLSFLLCSSTTCQQCFGWMMASLEMIPSQ